MKKKIITLICLVIVLASLVTLKFMTQPEKNMNHLGKEKSPYLLQHKDNPVWWYAWGEEAFEAAKEQNKPIFLSSGYSTCHWCHVMEHESFENQQVADILNQNFISIKVDREERPDVDKIYMDALVSMQGHGGWPMSLFLNHKLEPFYAGTYFPKHMFVNVLNQMAEAWKSQREKIDRTGSQISEHLNAQVMKGSKPEMLSNAILGLATNHAIQTYDSTYGGFGGAPKFPPSTKLQFLMRVASRAKPGKKQKEALSMVTHTLDKMARGGMYDHLGGGFHRYSTDEHWLTPHFEKMLYDNASLSWTYLEAFQLTKNEMFKEVGREILDYTLRDMTYDKGGFYSAEDADSEGEEGKFYVWTREELQKLLTPEAFKKISEVYGVNEHGNFEHGTNILNLQDTFQWRIKNDPILKAAKEKLFQIREKRIHPYKDDKILTDWNGLMIASMAKGYQVIGNKKYLAAAVKAATFIKETLYKNKRLLKRYRSGESKFEGTLDDYAYLIFGLVSLYEASFDAKWIHWALELQDQQNKLFWDNEHGGYFYTSKEVKHLLRRSKEYHDEARPNSNGLAALNLLKLYDFTFEKQYKEYAKRLLDDASSVLKKHYGAYAQMLVALDYYLDSSKEVVVIGKENDPKVSEILSYLNGAFLPNKILSFSTEQNNNQVMVTHMKVMIKGMTTVYVCEQGVCKLPVHEVDEVKKQITDFNRFELE